MTPIVSSDLERGSKAWWACVEGCGHLSQRVWDAARVRVVELRLENDGFVRVWQTHLLPTGEIQVLSRSPELDSAFELEWQFAAAALLPWTLTDEFFRFAEEQELRDEFATPVEAA
jgi:hypothetical protein